MSAVKKMVPKTIGAKMLAQQRALEAGKAGYKKADQLVDELVAEAEAGRIEVGAPIDLGNGLVGRLIDKFEGKNKVGYGGAARRYDVEISRADDIAKKL